MTYAALLRAVNVGGRGKMAMGELRTALEDAGLQDVATHGNTGNVVFSSTERSTKRVSATVQRALADSLGYKGDVFVLTHAQLAKAVADNPFTELVAGGAHQCYLAFLSATPAAKRRSDLEAADQDGLYRIAVKGRVLYYTYARADAGRRRDLDGDKVLGVRATARSFKVVDKLVALTA